MGGGIGYNDDIMHSPQKFIVFTFATILPHRNKHMQIGCESPAVDADVVKNHSRFLQ